MSYRFMRIMLFFDLPNTKSDERKAYTKFVKYLKNQGFMMLQYSVYVKLAITAAKAEAIIEKVRKEVPKKGQIDVLNLTEKQYASMVTLLGERDDIVINSDDRLIEL